MNFAALIGQKPKALTKREPSPAGDGTSPLFTGVLVGIWYMAHSWKIVTLSEDSGRRDSRRNLNRTTRLERRKRCQAPTTSLTLATSSACSSTWCWARIPQMMTSLIVLSK